jgi:hypothetical protein
VDLGLRPGDPGKNIQRPPLRPLPDRRIFYQLPDLLPRMVPVFVWMFVVIMRMFVVVFVLFVWLFVWLFVLFMVMFVLFMVMFVLFVVVFVLFVWMFMLFMVVFVRMFVVIPPGTGLPGRGLLLRGVVIVPVPQIHNGPGPVDPAAFIPGKVQLPSRKTQLAQFLPQRAGIKPQIHQGPQNHISGDTRETIKV